MYPFDGFLNEKKLCFIATSHIISCFDINVLHYKYWTLIRMKSIFNSYSSCLFVFSC